MTAFVTVAVLQIVRGLVRRFPLRGKPRRGKLVTRPFIKRKSSLFFPRTSMLFGNRVSLDVFILNTFGFDAVVSS